MDHVPFLSSKSHPTNHIGKARNPCTKATIGDTTTVAGTDITPEEAMVCATTARAVTGQRRETGHRVLNIVIAAVAAMAAITDMIGLVVTKFTATMQRMLLVRSRTVPTLELICSAIVVDL
eukprot:TRINITY_DN38161_c0_g1_i1.p1 TRINITY_DN38161_c0_g1~~TRINITY_DN38161_c0_g1_i1.p1  ORF type:complete len:121 (+),score=32.10 TRINITY_DN38161_c0_g1_i1:81-443(+)